MYNSNAKELITSGCFTVFNGDIPMWKVSLARKRESLFKYRHLNSEEPFPDVGPGRSSHSSDKLKYLGIQSNERLGLNSVLFYVLSMVRLTVPLLSACLLLPILNAFNDPHALKIQSLFFASFYMYLAYTVC